MTVKYLLNTLDSARPVYEVDFAAGTWRVVAYRRRQYGDDFISGKIRKPLTDFTGIHWKEVKKPTPGQGVRLAG